MKASVQYNDLTGTAAADISDHTNLNKFLVARGVDPDRYYAIGASFYSGYEDFFTASIICIDKELSTEAKKHIVKIGFEAEIDKDVFFGLFKRFNVVLSEKTSDYQEYEIDEEITIDDRQKKK